VSGSRKNIHLITERKPSALMNKSALADAIGACVTTVEPFARDITNPQLRA